MSNLQTWYKGGLNGGYEGALEQYGFLSKCTADETGPREIPRYKRRRMLNMDETHHYMGNAGDSSGSRANVWRDERLGQSGRRKVP